MENRAQTIVHLNSHGPKATFQTFDSANSSFGNMSTMPINDINKVGMLYAAIPRTWDCLHQGNRIVYFDIHTQVGPVEVEVHMPLINYYDPS